MMCSREVEEKAKAIPPQTTIREANKSVPGTFSRETSDRLLYEHF